MHADITIHRLGETLRLHVNETYVQENETKNRGRFMTEFVL